MEGYLQEELDTGCLLRAGRRPVADYIELSGIWWHWDGSAAARLTLVKLVPGTPPSVGFDLAWAAMHRAADAGASKVVTSLGALWVGKLGFRDLGNGVLATSTTFLAAQGWWQPTTSRAKGWELAQDP